MTNLKEIDLKKLTVTNPGGDVSVYSKFNDKINQENYRFDIGDEIWIELDNIWKNKFSLNLYLESMITNYKKLGHEKSLRYMGYIDTKCRDMTYSDEYMVNRIQVCKNKNEISNGRNRVILFHYMFNVLNSNNYNIFVEEIH